MKHVQPHLDLGIDNPLQDDYSLSLHEYHAVPSLLLLDGYQL